MIKHTFFAGFLLIVTVCMPLLVSAQTPTFYKTIVTITTKFIVQNQVGLTAAELNNTSTAENTQLKDALDAVIKSAVNLTAANITFPVVAGVSDVACPTTSNPAGAVCHLVSATFLIRYNASSFPTPPDQAVANAVSEAINAGLLQCRLAELYPTAKIRLRTGRACPETSTPPALLPTRAPVSPLNTFATLSNSFFISNNAGLGVVTLNTNGNQQRNEIVTAYTSLLNKTITDVLTDGAVIVAISTLNVSDTSCPPGLNGTCHLASAGFTLQYDPSNFSGTPPGTRALNRMQAAINAGNLICEHQRLFPFAVVVVRSGNKCPTDTQAPVVTMTPTSTPPPVLSDRFDRSATLTNNFRILNPGNITVDMLSNPANPAAIELLAAYNSLVTKRLGMIAAQSQLVWQYGSPKVGVITNSPCPALATATSLCHAVTATFVLNYTNVDFTGAINANVIVDAVQRSINSGDLDCELEALSPSSVLQVTTGGGCPGTSPRFYDSSATVTNGFLISNQLSITAATFLQANNAQAVELAAAYNALIPDVLKDLITEGAVVDGVATVGVFTPESTCPAGSTCHEVTGSFKIKFNSSNFPMRGVGQRALDLVQAAINAGSLICYHNRLNPSSVVTVLSGTTCPSSPVSITTLGPVSVSTGRPVSPTVATGAPAAISTTVPTISRTSSPVDSTTKPPTTSSTTAPIIARTSSPVESMTKAPTTSTTTAPIIARSSSPVESMTKAPTTSTTTAPTIARTSSPVESMTKAPTTSTTTAPTIARTSSPVESMTKAPTTSTTTAPTIARTSSPVESMTKAPTTSTTSAPTIARTSSPVESMTKAPTTSTTTAPTISLTSSPVESMTKAPTTSTTSAPTIARTSSPVESMTKAPTTSTTTAPTFSRTSSPAESMTKAPTTSTTSAPTIFLTSSPAGGIKGVPSTSKPVLFTESPVLTTYFPSRSRNPSSPPSVVPQQAPVSYGPTTMFQTSTPTRSAPIFPTTLPSQSDLPSTFPTKMPWPGSSAPVPVPTQNPNIPSPVTPTMYPSQSEFPSSFPSQVVYPVSKYPTSKPVNYRPSLSPVETPVPLGTLPCRDLENFPFFVNLSIGTQTCMWLRSSNRTAAEISVLCSSTAPLGYGYVLCAKTCRRC